MGALSMKITRLDLRKWDIKLTTAISTIFFMESLVVFVSQNCVIFVESKNNKILWLSERSKIFFYLKTTSIFVNKKDDIFLIFNFLTEIVYVLEFCSYSVLKHQFSVICATISIEVLSLLLALISNNSIFSIKKIQKTNLSLNLERNYQLNRELVGVCKINKSMICLLISINTKHQEEKIDFILKQRSLKNNFKCLMIGSTIQTTFPTIFLGSNVGIITNIVEGNHFFCQDLKRLHNPLIIYSNDIFSQTKSKANQNMLHVLRFLGVFSRSFFGFHIVSSAVIVLNLLNMQRVLPVTKNDLKNFKIVFFLNLPINNIWFFKNTLHMRITSFYFLQFPANKQTFINYGSKCLKKLLAASENVDFFCINHWNYRFIPQRNFFASHETFFNTNGQINRISQSISASLLKNTWSTFKKFFKHFKKTLVFLNYNKNIHRISFNFNSISNTKNLIWFYFFGCQALTYLNSHLILKNKSFIFAIYCVRFKFKFEWLYNAKLKHEFQDFFVSGNDPYSNYSKNLISCSKTKKLKTKINCLCIFK